MVAPSGEQYDLTWGGYHAVITECGAGLRILEYDGRPLVHGYAEDEPAPAGRGQLLLPWPNRIEDGAYTFGGRKQQLALSEPARGNAIHGLTRWTAWTAQAHTPDSVTLDYRLMAQKGYPWTLDLRVVHALSGGGLTVTVTATNRSAAAAPYALGAHPYLSVGDGPVDGWQLMVPADTRLVTDDRMIPVKRTGVDGTRYDFRVPRPVGDLRLDDGFTDLRRDADGTAEVELWNPATGRGVVLWMDRAHGWVQVYTGDDLPTGARASVAVEPMTAPANAFRTGEGLVVLDSEDSCTASWGLRVR